MAHKIRRPAGFRIRDFLTGFLALASTIAFAGCGETQNRIALSSPPVQVQVDDPLALAPLKQVAAESHLVLVGTVLSRETGIEFGSGPGTLTYTSFTIRPSRAVKGDPPETVRVLMNTHAEDGRTLEIEGRPTPPREGEAVWLLTAIDPQFKRPGDYVLTSLAGVLPASNGRIDLGDRDIETPAVREAVQLGTVQAVADYLDGKQPTK